MPFQTASFRASKFKVTVPCRSLRRSSVRILGYNRRYMDICPQGPQFAREFVNEADRE